MRISCPLCHNPPSPVYVYRAVGKKAGDIWLDTDCQEECPSQAIRYVHPSSPVSLENQPESVGNMTYGRGSPFAKSAAILSMKARVAPLMRLSYRS